MQAFLREDLTVFCREAPSEFNDHQREVFCVFSGTGVGRLREYLNGGGTDTPLETGIVDSEDEDGVVPVPPEHGQLLDQNQTSWTNGDQDGLEDEDMEDDETPADGQDGNAADHSLLDNYIDVHVDSTAGNENVAIASPHGLGLARPAFLHQQDHSRTQSWDGVGGAMWAHGSGYIPTPPSLGPSPGPMAGPSTQNMTVGSGSSGGSGREAQHVTGLMGAVNMVDTDESR